MTDRTIRESSEPGSINPIEWEPDVVRTVREVALGATFREPPKDEAGDAGTTGIWLPREIANRFTVVEELPTRGSEADLYIVCDAKGHRFVSKIYRKGIKPKEQILNILKKANPEHVVQLIAFGEDSGRWWELIEYMELSSLRVLIDDEKRKFSDTTIRKVLRELSSAVAHLHLLGIEHRDLKPDNVLVRTTEPLDLVLADFGISSVMEATFRFTDTARTIKYAPPEAIGSIISEQGGGTRNVVTIARTRWDYWSLGIILVEILTGRHPYNGLSEAAIGHQLATQNVDDLVEGVEDGDWRKLCRGLLRRSPSKRWGDQEVNRWLANARDTRLAVEEDTEPAESSRASIVYYGKKVFSPSDLLQALRQDWGRAKEYFARGTNFNEFEEWLRFKLGLVEFADAMQKIEREPSLTLEARTFSYIQSLAKLTGDTLVKYKDQDISQASVSALAEQAYQGNQVARGQILELYEGKILQIAADLGPDSGMKGIARAWQEGVADYRRKLEDVEHNGARAPSLTGDTLLTLLIACTPVPSALKELKSAAAKATNGDARECEWFESLEGHGKPTVGALMIIPHVIKEAEAGAKQQKYDDALRIYGTTATFFIEVSIMTFGAAVLAYIPGGLVLAAIEYFASSEAALKVKWFWIFGWSVAGMLRNKKPPEKLVGNKKKEAAWVKNNSISYVFLGLLFLGSIIALLINDLKTEGLLASKEVASSPRVTRIQEQVSGPSGSGSLQVEKSASSAGSAAVLDAPRIKPVASSITNVSRGAPEIFPPASTSGSREIAQATIVPPRVDPKRPNTQPAYPRRAQSRGESGEVILEILVGQTGDVRDVRVEKSSGSRLLDESALEHVGKEWRFIPGTRGGQPEQMSHQVKISFMLQ